MGWQKINESELHVLMWMNFKNIKLRVTCAITDIYHSIYMNFQEIYETLMHSVCMCACVCAYYKVIKTYM